MDWAGGWCWLDRYELEGLASEVLSLDHRPSAGLLIAGVTGTPPQPERARCRTATRYGGAVDVKRAADLYAQGWTLRQVGTELGVSSTTVSEQLRRAGVAMRRGGPPAHPASTQQIAELRDRGLSWTEVAERVDMTRSGAWSRDRRAGRQSPHAWAGGSGCWPTRSTRTSRSVSGRPSLIISAELQPGLNSPPPDEPPMASPPLVVPGSFTCPVRIRTPMKAIALIWCWRSRM